MKNYQPVNCPKCSVAGLPAFFACSQQHFATLWIQGHSRTHKQVSEMDYQTDEVIKALERIVGVGLSVFRFWSHELSVPQGWKKFKTANGLTFWRSNESESQSYFFTDPQIIFQHFILFCILMRNKNPYLFIIFPALQHGTLQFPV